MYTPTQTHTHTNMHTYTHACPSMHTRAHTCTLMHGKSHGQRSLPGYTSIQFSSFTQSCQTLCNPMDCSTPGLPIHHQLPELTQTHVYCVGDAIQPSHLPSSPSLCRPLLLLPAIPPSIRVFSNESTLLMRWPKYWSFTLNHLESPTECLPCAN